VNDHLNRTLVAVLAHLEAGGAPLPTVQLEAWQSWPAAESAYLWAADGSGQGVWVDTAKTAAEQVAMVADQVQDWAVEELCRLGLPTNWPRCPEHPVNHPMEPAVDAGVAVWRCSASKRPACEIGHLA
jgi:hypothetical protein